MDSAGNEVIIVDDRAQTNGFNGNYSEEVIAAAAAAASSEMKTRSKAIASNSGPGEAAKLRSRAAANVANSHNTDKAPASPATVISASSNVSTVATSSSSSASDKDKKMNLRSGVTDSQAESGSSKATSGDTAAAGGKKNAVDGTPGPKSSKKGSGSVGDREDDSGINSRSSSVSTDDTYSSRLRTRSKRAEPLISSTPASAKKSASRMPLSTYDYDDDSMILHIEEDHSSSGSSLKRKATKVVIEEMEDDEPAAGTAAEDDEPPVKITVRRTSFFNVLLNPLKAFRGKIFYGSQIEEQDEKPAADNDQASQTNVSKVSDEGSKTEYIASQTEHNSEASTATTATNENGKETSNTCTVM